jgi:hypothetical protein
MEPTAFTAFAAFLKAIGPYGLVAVPGWVFWRVNEKKDRELKDLHSTVVKMAEGQTAAITKVEAALIPLKEAIDGMRRVRG